MITVLYSCKTCGLKDIAVQVPARETVERNVINWTHKTVIPALMDDHFRRRPHCHARSFADVKIPCPPTAEFLGQQIE